MKATSLSAGIFTLLTSTFAFAQSLTADIPFEFQASTRKFSAGNYVFSPVTDSSVIKVIGSTKDEFALVKIVTRMAGGIHTTRNDSHIVFDKVGGTHFLSEIWMTGRDGYVLATTKEQHTHEIVDVPDPGGDK